MTDNDDKYKNLFGSDIINLDKDRNKDSSQKRFVNRVKIGEGGQASVYKVYDSHLKIYRAMKIVHSQFASNKEFVNNYKNEVNITSQLNYPSIVKVYDADLERDELFIIMDYVEGKTLSFFKKFPEVIAAIIGCQIADALAYAHFAKLSFEDQKTEGIVHGDIKPSNLIIREDGQVMIMDFGLAKANRKNYQSSSGTIFGTLAYAPPELFENEETTMQSDIYSLGVTLYQLITGRTGYENDTQISITSKKAKNFSETVSSENINPDLFKIICKATRKNKSERYNDANELKEDLNFFIEKYYKVNLSAKNTLGAYINFGVQPDKKDSNESNILITDHNDESFKYQNRKKAIKYGLIPVVFLILVAMGLSYFLTKSSSDKADEIIVEQNVEEVIKKEDSPSQDHNEPTVTKSKEEVTTKAQRPASAKQSYERKIIVNNKSNLKGKIYIDNNYVGKLSDSKFTYKIANSGKYNIRIVTNESSVFEKRLEFDNSDEVQQINYDPIIYSLKINNPQEAKAKVYLNDENLGNLGKGFEKKFYKPTQVKLRIVNNKKNVFDFEQTINLQDTKPQLAINYNPVEEKKYLLTIENPQQIEAYISLDEKDPEALGSVYKKSFDDAQKVGVEIIADGYKKSLFSADFQQGDELNFTYEPIKTHSNLIIENVPTEAQIIIDGLEPIISKAPKTIVDNLEIGKNYQIIIRKDNFQDWHNDITISKADNNLRYEAQLNVGAIVFEPEINEALLRHTSIYLDDKEIGSTKRIENLEVGSHTIGLFFKLNEYTKRTDKKINVKPLSTDGSNETVVRLNFDFVSINSTSKNTKIYVDNQFVGYADIVVPFQNSTSVKITAEAPNGIPKYKYINPKHDKTVVFKTPNPAAEQLFIDGDALLTEYRTEENKSDFQNLLQEADKNFQQAIDLDPTYAEAYSRKIYVLTEKLEIALEKDNQDLAENLIIQMVNWKEDSMRYLESKLEQAILFKNIGKSYYLYAENFLEDSQKQVYIEKNSLEELEKSFELLVSNQQTDVKYPEIYDVDEAKCFLAKVYQTLYFLSKNSEYKRKAKTIWSRTYFSDYNLDRGIVIPNGFRREKQEWSALLD